MGKIEAFMFEKILLMMDVSSWKSKVKEFKIEMEDLTHLTSPHSLSLFHSLTHFFKVSHHYDISSPPIHDDSNHSLPPDDALEHALNTGCYGKHDEGAVKCCIDDDDDNDKINPTIITSSPQEAAYQQQYVQWKTKAFQGSAWLVHLHHYRRIGWTTGCTSGILSINSCRRRHARIYWSVKWLGRRISRRGCDCRWNSCGCVCMWMRKQIYLFVFINKSLGFAIKISQISTDRYKRADDDDDDSTKTINK